MSGITAILSITQGNYHNSQHFYGYKFSQKRGKNKSLRENLLVVLPARYRWIFSSMCLDVFVP